MSTPLPPSPFVVERGFVLDVAKFEADIEPLPTCAPASPRPEYLAAAEILPILAVLAGQQSGGDALPPNAGGGGLSIPSGDAAARDITGGAL